MSIINDALKKTQNVYQAQKNNQTSTAPADASLENKTKDTMVLTTTIIVAGGFIGCLVVLLILLWPRNPIGQKALKEKFSPTEKNTAFSQKILPPSTVPPSGQSLKGIKLTGIAFASGEQTALINGKIVKEGDEIEGKRVLRISDNQVKLFENGKVFVLELKP